MATTKRPPHLKKMGGLNVGACSPKAMNQQHSHWDHGKLSKIHLNCF